MKSNEETVYSTVQKTYRKLDYKYTASVPLTETTNNFINQLILKKDEYNKIKDKILTQHNCVIGIIKLLQKVVMVLLDKKFFLFLSVTLYNSRFIWLSVLGESEKVHIKEKLGVFPF